MKNKHLIFLFSCIFLLLLNSCESVKITYSTTKPLKKVQKVALVSTSISPVRQPLFPLIDAGILNEKTNKISNDIMVMEKKQIKEIERILTENLKQSFKFELVYAENLHQLGGFSQAKAKYHFPKSLRTQNENYPLMIMADTSFVPFAFESGKIWKGMQNGSYKSAAATICKELDVEMLIVSDTYLSMVNANTFGISGALRLETNLFLLDKDGDLLASGISVSKAKNVIGSDIGDYLLPWSNFDLIVKAMMTQFLLKYPK